MQALTQQGRKFRGITGIGDSGGPPLLGKTPPALQRGCRLSGFPARCRERHALPPLPVRNAGREPGNFPACVIVPTGPDKHSPPIGGDVKIFQRKKPEGTASKAAPAEDCLAARSVKDEEWGPPAAQNSKERQARDERGPAARQRRRKAVLHPNKEQEQPETEEERAKKTPEALPTPTGENPQHEEPRPFAQAGPGQRERGLPGRCLGSVQRRHPGRICA